MSDAKPTHSQESGAIPLRKMRGGTVARVLRLARKELREILRDRRTIVTLVLMPVLVYPLLSLAFQRFLVSSMRPTGKTTQSIGVENQEQADQITRTLEIGSQILREREARQRATTAKPEDGKPDAGVKDPAGETHEVEFFITANPERSVAEGSVDLAIRLTPREDTPGGGDSAPQERNEPLFTFTLIGREGDAQGQKLLAEVERRLAAVNERSLQARLRQLGAIPYVPARQERKLVKPVGSSASSLKTLVPLILVLMTITGAVYPAIDLTAGERERGTLEMLIAAPVPRLELMLGKYLAVLTVALLTATANMLAMTVTIFSMGMGKLVLGESGLTPAVVLQVFGLMVLFAAFFSGVLLALTSFARSFKEAQAYLIPLMMVSIAPGLLSLTPDLKLNGLLAVTPLVNIVLLARDIFSGAEVSPVLAAVTVFSTLLFAIAALGLAARVFGTDAILYGSQGNWSDLLRGPAEPQATASVSGAMLCLALLFPALFVANNGLARLPDFGIEWKLVMRGGAQLLLFAGFPLVAAWFARVRLGSGFSLRGATIGSFLGAALMGLSLWPLAYQIFAITRALGLATISEEMLAAVKAMIGEQRSLSLVWVVVTFGCLPAISEELFFRGFLFGALRGRMSAAATVVVSAVVFGLFHLVALDSLAVERLLPTTAIGLALGWVRSRSGSVFPGMLLHALHNSFLVLVAYYHTELAAIGIGQQEQDFLPWTWILGGVVSASVAAAIVFFFTGKSNSGIASAPGVQ